MKNQQNNRSAVAYTTFLKDVLICSLGAYGGPEAHLGIFMDQMVAKRKYLKEEELVELLALCSILPGPTSTQTLVSIGYKMGGPVLAFLSMLVWAAPALLIMTALSFLYSILSHNHISSDILRFIGPMAVGFIILAAWRIGRKVVIDTMTLLLMLFGAMSTYFIHTPWIFPLILLIGGGISIIATQEKNIWNRIQMKPPWHFLIIFMLCTIGSIALSFGTDLKILELFEHFYRYGYLVFGGGQVVVPVMHSELVELNGYMSHGEFLTGYGLVQGLPGPMFSFAAYAGGMAARGGSVLQQILGSLAGGIGIFLPGLLLIYFIYPIWENLKKIKAIKISLKGINAVAGGMILAAAILLMQTNGFTTINVLISILTVALLYTKKIPAPLIVALTLLAGIFL